jgi:hypothetical protein
MELDDAAFNQPLGDLVKEKAVSLLIELRAKGNTPYTESLDFIRRLSTFIDILIFDSQKFQSNILRYFGGQRSI